MCIVFSRFGFQLVPRGLSSRHYCACLDRFAFLGHAELFWAWALVTPDESSMRRRVVQNDTQRSKLLNTANNVHLFHTALYSYTSVSSLPYYSASNMLCPCLVNQALCIDGLRHQPFYPIFGFHPIRCLSTILVYACRPSVGSVPYWSLLRAC